MSTTLTNGLKLPDKGSVDWYADMQNNYTILDGAVGTIAEHTTQIAGKAPAVHTHTKADITDFPAYGTTAGTICEGNDSRLSDARTPVAHTHTKSDVTDLFNSANTWSNGNSFQHFISLNGDRNAYIVPMWAGAASGMSFLAMDATKQFVFGQRTTDANNRYVYDQTKGFLVIRTGETGGCNYVDVIPYGSDTRLGGSTNKWKTLNGINPGALSLPGTGGYTDIKGDITNLSGGDNTFTAPYDGWVCVKSANATVIHIINTNWAVCQSTTQNTAGTLCCLCPVMSGQSFKVIVIATSLEYAYIHPCKGNV